MAHFGITESTAREYTRALLQKFGCRNRTMVLRTALELGMLLPGADGLNSTSPRVQKSWVTFPSESGWLCIATTGSLRSFRPNRI